MFTEAPADNRSATGAGRESSGGNLGREVSTDACRGLLGSVDFERDLTFRDDTSLRAGRSTSLRLVEFPKLQETGLFFCLLCGLRAMLPPWIMMGGRPSNTAEDDKNVAGESPSLTGVSGICMFNS
jgi:hypothetical protein